VRWFPCPNFAASPLWGLWGEGREVSDRPLRGEESKFFSRALKKNVNPLSHFRAARATSITWLRFAPCTIRIKAE